MKYDMQGFNSAVEYYKKSLKGCKEMFLIFDVGDADAFYSIAPLSRALHELGGDMNCLGIRGKSASLQVLENIWKIDKERRDGKKTAATGALQDFIDSTKIKGFDRLFSRPGCIVRSTKSGWDNGLAYKAGWFKSHRWALLLKTSKVIYEQVYNLRRGERVNVGFELLLPEKDMQKPLEDHLDSYAISRAMFLAAQEYGEATLNASTSRMSMLEPMNRVSDLRTTILGCELSKTIAEPVLKKFNALSRHIGSSRLKVADANFFITGKGYGGKHLFGEKIGYPDPSRKTRWQSPGMFIYKLDYYPQTKIDSRKPRSRVGFTDTLPIDLFIKTCNIDWYAMKRRDDILKRIAEKSDRFVIRSNVDEKDRTDFEVGLVKPDGTHRWPRGSDIDIRDKINKEYLRRTGIVAGSMANLPGGEMFVTPEYVKGTIAGDVVISIDQSYPLSPQEPIVIDARGHSYRIKSGPKDIIDKFKKKKAEAWRQILSQEKNGSIPAELIRLKKKNFERIGEFAINTNPKAELSGYLIVDEKIANMIHIALGSGFEPDRATEYHTDIVIDARRQKLDIYGESGKVRRYILKQGRFVV
jgi:hypothetical protein